MTKFFVFITVCLAITLTSTGCSTKVKRTPVEQTIDISGKWNDTDSRLVAEEMIQDGLNRPWLERFKEKKERTPVIIVGSVKNRSHEHINSQLFIKDLERALINSGEVRFVASAEERGELRNERSAQQEGFTAEETIKEFGRETGADFMLQGSINSVKDELKGRYVILYQVNLELIDLTTNEKVWIGQKEIKKYVKKRAFTL